MLIGIVQFSGRFPRIDPRQLVPSAAQLALNCRYDSGALAPIRNPRLVHTFDDPVLTVFRDGVTWLGFDKVVSIARGPVAQDRLYYTGDGAPKMRVSGSTYALALPAPVSAPTVTNASAPGPDTEDVLWAYTWVTSFGEESQPSPLFGPIQLDQAITQDVTGFATTPASRGITHRRLYRSQTSASGATQLYFVTEIPVATTTFTYDPATMPLAEPIPSINFDPPPAGLRGLVSMPNGMMAAFDGKELFFCEPYQPHAWPEKYALAVDADIVALASFGSSLAVLTRNAPYVAQGITPDTVALERIEGGAPCVSARGVVDLGYSAAYPSPDGIILVGDGQRQNITTTLFNRDQWGDVNPSSIIAARFDDRLMLVHNATNLDLYDAGAPAGWPEPPGTDAEFETSGPALAGDPLSYITYDFGAPNSSFGDQVMSWICPSRVDDGFTTTNIAVPSLLYSEETTGSLYFVGADGVSLYEWESPAQGGAVTLWRSKVFSTNAPTNAGAIYVKTDRDSGEGDTFKARLYAGGDLIREITRANRIERLPAARLNTRFEIEIESSVAVLAAYVAETPDDILVAIQ